MSNLYQLLLTVHIASGALSLILFWAPIATKKGSPLHIRSGLWYIKVMYGVALSAIFLAIILMTDPISAKYSTQSISAEKAVEIIAMQWDVGLFLLAISFLVTTNLTHGLRSLRARKDQSRMRSPVHLLLNLILLTIGLYLGYSARGGSPLSVLFYVFAALCSTIAIRNLYYCFKDSVTRNERIVAHLGSMIGAGIGVHTAFFVFGASRFTADTLSNYWGILPWVLPGVIGTFFIIQQSRKYRKPVSRTTETRS